jgi:hypothetical protein
VRLTLRLNRKSKRGQMVGAEVEMAGEGKEEKKKIKRWNV